MAELEIKKNLSKIRILTFQHLFDEKTSTPFLTSFSLFFFQIPDQESARKARPGDPFTFTVDASKTGWGEVAIDVVYDNRSIRRTFYVEEVGNRIYNVWNNKIVL